jgi:transmembrane sensor
MKHQPPSSGAAAASEASQHRRTPEQALAAHGDALRAHFPLPDLERLSREAAARAARRRMRAGLGMLGAVLVASGLWLADPAYRSEHYAAAVGEQRELLLADGSRATLDSGTQLDMAWHLRSRRAELQQGRVLLEVAHSQLRPFTVQADRAQVRVTGTRFEVERQQGEVAVYLAQGAVQLHLDQRLPGEEEHYALRPGMSATLGAHRATLLAQGTHGLGWARGELVFERERLASVLAQLQRYVHQPIRLADASLADMPVSGVFRTSQVQAVFDLLPLIGPMQIRHGSDGAIVVERRADAN